MQPLTEYEMKLARLIQDGLSYREMANVLGMSPSTVKSHVDRIRWNLGVKHKRQIPGVLRELGLL